MTKKKSYSRREFVKKFGVASVSAGFITSNFTNRVETATALKGKFIYKNKITWLPKMVATVKKGNFMTLLRHIESRKELYLKEVI